MGGSRTRDRVGDRFPVYLHPEGVSRRVTPRSAPRGGGGGGRRDPRDEAGQRRGGGGGTAPPGKIGGATGGWRRWRCGGPGGVASGRRGGAGGGGAVRERVRGATTARPPAATAGGGRQRRQAASARRHGAATTRPPRPPPPQPSPLPRVETDDVRAELDQVAVLQGRGRLDRLAVEPGAQPAVVVFQEELAVGLAGDAGVLGFEVSPRIAEKGQRQVVAAAQQW